MAENQVRKLWTAIISALVALCAALGFVTTTATTAVAQTESPRNSDKSRSTVRPVVPAASPWAWLLARALPPTMKQRIHAEAHGASPSCRHRSLPEAEPADHLPTPCDPEDTPDEPATPVPLQR
jgi:hypothetical protein